MYRFITVMTLLVLFSIPNVVLAEPAPVKRNWIERQIIHLKVYPHRAKAYSYLKEDKSKEAAAEFAKVLEIDPYDTNVRLDYSQTLYDLGEYSQAKVQAMEVLKLLPESGGALMLAVSSLQKLGNNSEALDLLLGTLKKGVLSQKAQENAFVSAVDLLIKQKEYALLLNVVGNEKNILFPAKHDYILGLAYKGAGELDKARAAYEKALAYTGDDALSTEDRLVALSDVADILIQSKEYDKAQKILLEARTLAPDLMSITYRLAEISYDTEQYEKALQWINLSLKDEQTSKQLLLKAFILEELGESAQALILFDRLVKSASTKKEKAELFIQKGFVAMKVGNNEAAILAFKESISVMPTTEAMEALATAQGLNGEWAMAVETYTLLLSHLSDGAEKSRARMQLGIAYIKLGNDAEAISQLVKARDSGHLSAKDQEAVLQNLGFLYYRSKQYAAAEKAFLEALAQQPDNDETLLALGRAQLDAGQYKDAIETFTKLDKQQHDFAVSMLLAYAYEKDGQPAKAAAIYKSVLESEILPGENTMVVLERMATLESVYGRKQAAGDLYLKAYDAAEKKDPTLLLRAGESYYGAKQYPRALQVLHRYLKAAPNADNYQAYSMMGAIYSKQGKTAEAISVYKRALASSKLTPKQRKTILVSLGYMSIAMGKVDEGVNYMQQAIAVGGEDMQLRLEIGLALYSAEKYPEAIEQLRRAKELGAGYEADTTLGFCYEKLNKPGLALHYMKQAELSAPPDVLLKSDEIYNQLGFLYSSEKSYLCSIEYYQRALCVVPRPLTVFKLGQVQRLAGQHGAAEATLLSISPEQLESAETRMLYYEELGRIYKDAEQYEKAQEIFRKGIAEQESATGFYLLGQSQEAVEDHKGAIQSFQRAVDLNPAEPYKTSLGYAYYRDGELEKAALIFGELLKNDSDYISLAEDLAHINKQLCRNDLSVAWFKRAIDNAEYYPNETEDSLRRKIYDFKEEIRYITNRWDITGFYSYSPDDANFFSDAQGVQVGVLNNTAGVEVAYIPPKIGFRNARIFELIARVSVNRLDNGVVDFDADGTQGAAGIRYKPFSDYNLAVGVERLFRIGDNAEDNTLVRVMGSLDDGWAMKAAESNWNYTFLYGEFDQYVEEDSRSVFLIHGRQGWTWNVADQLLISPHGYITYQDVLPDRDGLSHVEGGPAISFRWLEGEDEYISYKREWEVLVRYTFGKYTKDNNDGNDDYSGVSVALRFNF